MACTSPLNVNSVARPPKPFSSVPKGWSWMAERFSVWIQLTQAVVKPQGAAPDSTIFLEKFSISAQVFGAVSRSRPAFSNTSLL
ncbi:hypothetical protein D3C87_2058930 [compost metagenome]